MSFFSGLWRMVKSVFGLAEGATERATDALVSGSPEAIRAQFRKTREDWIKDYNQMRDSIADLIRIRETRVDEIKKLEEESNNIAIKMTGAIELFKQNPDERYREAYAKLATQNEQLELRIKELNSNVEEQKAQIEGYKTKLIELQSQIASLSKEEAETVADIVSSKKIRELNDRLSGISFDSQSKNLEAIRSARQKAKAVAKISTEMSSTKVSSLDAELSAAGSASKHVSAFDLATQKQSKVTAITIEPQALPKSRNDIVDVEVEKLLEGIPVEKK